MLRSGKIFRLRGAKRTVTDREGECSSTEGSDYGLVLPDEEELWEKKTVTTQYHSDKDSSQVEHYVGPTTLGAAWNAEVRPKSPMKTSF